MSFAMTRQKAVSGPGATRPAAQDWLRTQRAVLGVWLDRLIAEGDPDDLISMIHRHAAWLDMMDARVSPSDAAGL